MREICTSGSVRGEGGNILTYSAPTSFPISALPRECWSCIADFRFGGTSGFPADSIHFRTKLMRAVALEQANAPSARVPETPVLIGGR
jgi:hypothetical protein